STPERFFSGFLKQIPTACAAFFRVLHKFGRVSPKNSFHAFKSHTDVPSTLREPGRQTRIAIALETRNNLRGLRAKNLKRTRRQRRFRNHGLEPHDGINRRKSAHHMAVTFRQWKGP